MARCRQSDEYLAGQRERAQEVMARGPLPEMSEEEWDIEWGTAELLDGLIKEVLEWRAGRVPQPL